MGSAYWVVGTGVVVVTVVVLLLVSKMPADSLFADPLKHSITSKMIAVRLYDNNHDHYNLNNYSKNKATATLMTTRWHPHSGRHALALDELHSKKQQQHQQQHQQ